MNEDNAFELTQSERDRLHRAIKGTNRFANTKTRVVVSECVLRDDVRGPLRSVVQISRAAGGSGKVTITDPTGNPYAMTNIVGFAQGAALR